MINFISRPDEFSYLPMNIDYLELSNESGPYIHLAVEIIGPYASIHANMLRWTHNVFKDAVKEWENLILFTFIPFGVTQITANTPNINDKRFPKLIKLFGFPEPVNILISTMEI